MAQKFRIITFTFYSLLVFFIETARYHFNDSLRNVVIDFSCFFIFLYLTFNLRPINKIYIIITFFYEIVELICWRYNNKPFDFQMARGIDMIYVIRNHPIFILYAFVAFFFIGLFSSIDFWCFEIEIKRHNDTLLCIFGLYLLYFLTLNIYKAFYPFTDSLYYNQELLKRLRNQFFQPPTIKKIHPNEPFKNIVLYHVESLEMQTMGIYNTNTKYRGSMPFLSNLSQTTTFCSNAIQTIHTGFTSTSVLLVSTALPHICEMPLPSYKIANGFSDYLQLAGYDLLTYSFNFFDFMGLRTFLEAKGFTAFDELDNDQLKGDYLSHLYIENHVIPNLSKAEKPWVLYLHNEDTHIPFNVECEEFNVDPTYPKCLQAFNCWDSRFKRLVEALKKNGLNSTNTEVIIYGDHLAPGFFDDSYPLSRESRKLAILFPFMEKNTITKQVTLYDIPSTILHIADLEFSPPFAFGANIFSNETGVIPSEDDFMYLAGIPKRITPR